MTFFFQKKNNTVIIKFHTGAVSGQVWSWRVDPGSGLFVPRLISGHLWSLRERSDTDDLLLNSVISVAPVWKPGRVTGRLPSEGD